MNKIRVSAKTYDEAVTKAQIELQSTEEHLKISVVERGTNGLFGFIGGKPWVIEASVKTEEEERKEEEEKAAKAKAEKAAADKAAREKRQAEAEAKRKAEAEAKKKAEAEKAQKAAAPSAASAASAAESEKASEKNAPAAGRQKEDRPERPGKGPKKGAGKEASQDALKGRRRRGQNPEKETQRDKAQEQRQERPDRKRREETVGREVMQEEADEIKAKAVAFLQDIFRVMGEEIEIDTDFNYQDNELNLMMSGSDMGALIGKRGQTLDSLQYLVSLVVNKHRDVYIRVKLDTENYRERREQKLKSLAKNIAFKVKRTKKPVSLEPMNPYERRIIHSALQRDPYVTTYSEGDDPFRHIVVTMKKDGGKRRSRFDRRKSGSAAGTYDTAGHGTFDAMDEAAGGMNAAGEEVRYTEVVVEETSVEFQGTDEA